MNHIYRRLFLTFFGSLLVTALSAQITVTFPGTQGPCIPATVQLQSTNPNTSSVSWTITDPAGVDQIITSGPSTGYNAPLPGLHNVVAVIYLSNGTTVTETTSFTVNAPPVLNFTPSSPVSGCAPLNVNFSAAGTTGTAPLTYLWDFCDGDSSNAVSPSHTYNAQGCYCMQLIVTDANGCKSATTQLDYICVIPPPVACMTTSAATPPASCSSPYTINFQSCSAPPGMNHEWSFPGGTPATSTSPNPSVTYNSQGSFGVTLTVTNPTDGCSSTITNPTYVNIGNATTSINVTPNDSICLGETVTLNAPAGTWTSTPNIIDGIQPANPTITPPAAGNYTVNLTVSLAGGCSASASATISVADTPVPSFTVNGGGPSCVTPLNVTVTNTTPGGPWEWLWDFTGATANINPTVPNPPAHQYNTCGTYPITLTANTPGFPQCAATATVASAVVVNCLEVEIGLTPPNGQSCAPFTHNFTATPSIPGTYTYQWDFNYTAPGNFVTGTQQMSHLYPNAGCYNAAVRIFNAAGCTAIAVMDTVQVGTLLQPPLCFTSDTDEVCAQQSITFTMCPPPAVAPVPNCGQITYDWDFGDGDQALGVLSPGNPPPHQYSDTGVFDVQVIRCWNGCCDTLKIDTMITVHPPITKLKLTYNCATNKVHASTDGSIGVDVFDWTLPAGVTWQYQTANGDSGILNFPAGTTNLSITVLGTNTQYGCSMPATASVGTVPPLANVSVTPLSGCCPLGIAISNPSVGTTAYEWIVLKDGQSFFTSTLRSLGSSLSSYTWGATNATSPCGSPNGGPGVYTFIYIAKNADPTCNDTMIKTVTINGADPEFTATPEIGCTPLTVQFTDITAQPVTSWSWNFDDSSSGTGNNTSTQQNPSHTFNATGVYDVKLCVTTASGCSSCDSLPIQVGTPSASFHASDTVLCVGNQLCFIPDSSAAVAIASYAWDFGDGTSSTAALPCHSYDSVGVFTVSLVLTDVAGCTASLTRTDYISVGGLLADFTTTGPTVSSCPPLPVNFVNTTEGYDSIGWTSAWFFGDGYFSSIVNPFHIYNQAGNFTVCLTVTSPEGCSNTRCDTNLVQIDGPTANVSATADSGCAPLSVSFSANPTNSISFTWNYGQPNTPVNPSNLPTSEFTYTLADTMYASVLLCNNGGCCYYLPVDTIYVDSVFAEFTMSSSEVCELGTVIFTDTSRGITDIVAWEWDFGDGSTSTLQNPSHTYTTGFGDYVVTLTAKSALNCVDTFVDTVHVTPSPVADFVSGPPPLCVSDSVVFVSTTSSLSPIDHYIWNIDNDPNGITTTDSFITHLFTTPGSHTVFMTAYSTNGCFDSDSMQVTISPLPTADAGNDTTVCINTAAQLHGTGGVEYAWSPGPTPPNVANPTVDVSQLSTYTLTVTSSNGCTASDEVVVSVTLPPQAGIAYDDSICYGTSTIITASGGMSYTWSPATGLSQTTGAAVTASPAADETYTVVVADAIGCTSDTTAFVTVLPPPPAQAGPDTAICIGQPLQLHASGGISYEWTPGNMTDQNPAVNVTSTTLFSVKVTDVYGCFDTAQVSVVVNPLPNAYAGADAFVCLNECMELQATGGAGYAWSAGTNPSNVANPEVCPIVATTYSVTVTSDVGCTASDEVAIGVNPLPQPAISSNDSVCRFATITFTASGGVSYQWLDAGGNIVSSTNPFDHTADSASSFTVVVTDVNSCTADTSVSFTVVPLPAAVAGPDTSICTGQPLQFFADGGVSYAWTPAELLNDPTQQNPASDSIPASTNFLVTVSNAFGCTNTAQVSVTILPPPNVTINPVLYPVCIGATTQLTANGAVTYEWSPTEFIVGDPQQQIIIANPGDTMNYIVTGTDASGCRDRDGVEVIVLFPFEAQFSADSCLCAGECMTLHAIADTTLLYTWTPALFLDDPSSPSPTACPANDVVYQAVVSDRFCFADSGVISICVNELPRVIASNDTTILAGSVTTLKATASVPGTYAWLPDTAVSCATCPTIEIDPPQLTTYYITFTDENGCQDDDTVIVNVFCNDASIYIPNAFTPDGDGVNESWMVYGQGFELKYLRIYDRWGEKVFETDRLDTPWDGTFNDHKIEPEVFIYNLQAVCASGEVLSKKGNITLIR